MAELVSKSGTKSVDWDYFGLELSANGKSSMAVLFSEVVGNEC